jgi:DNA-directed RNA polymerase subunit RPC12/RpoP
MNKLPDKYVLYRCSQCGEIFTKENMIEYETVWVCAACKPVFLQKIKEGIEIVPKPANMLGWKIFLFIYLALASYLSIFLIRSIFNGEQLFQNILKLIMGLLVIVALFGFAFGKKIWNRVIWKTLFPAVVALNAIETIQLFLKMPFSKHPIAYFIVFIVFLPLLICKYVALYKYAFSRRKPWI